jgi:hypothetical protein
MVGYLEPLSRSKLAYASLCAGSTVAQDLLDRLGGAALDPSDPGRRESLIQICRTAGRARRRTRNHPSSWTFGPWEDEVLFPSVTADSQIVLEERHD